ncbi:MAG: tetratricopeptide repeat protein [Parafannyhessea sp.]|uniref:tetratricopeptide repeat protein n=1 Tax=Parafannyhessea sp. TaxID=2847324 RepID=UPI003F0BCE10
MESSSLYRELDRLYGEPGADVEGFLREALRRARLAGDGSTCVAVANELGSVLRLRGDLSESEELYNEVLSELERLGAGDDERARALINLGDVYVAQGRHERAVESFDRAEALLGSGDDHPYEVSAICNNRSAALRGLGRFAEARRDLRRAGRLLESVPNSEGRRATNAINLAQVLIDEGRLDEAEEAIAPALEAYRTLSGGRDVHRPHALATAAKVAYLRGRYEEAEGLYRKAADVLRDKLGDSPNVRALEREAERMETLCQP